SNSHSLLWWMKRLIALRKKYSELSNGHLRYVDSNNNKILTFIREHEGRSILIAANLSRNVQYVELNLAEFKGFVPVEVFGQIEFPTIGELPYFLTMAPYSFYWFELLPKESEEKSWLVNG